MKDWKCFIDDFINEIKDQIELVEDKRYPRPIHKMGSTILTNNEMKAMLSVYYDWFEDVPSNIKRKISDYVFDELRGIYGKQKE